jgi:DNA-directed RNA polymerase subunit K/omega
MSDIKTKSQGLDPNITARDIQRLIGDAENIYEALNIINRRSRQISVELKQELLSKLEEFAISSDTIEEIHENKEQIEISKFYERLPNPVLIATEEFLNGELHHFYRHRKELD